MSHEQVFLADISEHPDDDTPRLVYADWLEDHGDTEADRARAEFIRVQCELASLGEHDLVRRAKLEAREQELLQRYGKAWSAPLRKYSKSFTFRRGFADRITLRGEVFLKEADEVARLTPLCDVKLRDCKAVVEGLAASPHLAKLRSLSLDFNKLGVARLRTLLASKHLKNLRALDLSNNALSSGAGEVLARAKCLGNLTELTLDYNDLGGVGLAALARAPWLKRLRSLRLVSTGLRPGTLRDLLGGLSGGELRHLDLSQSPDLGDEGLEALASSPAVGGLTTLALQWLTYGWSGDAGHPTGRGLKALAGSPHLNSLASLDLSQNAWVAASLGGLAEAPPLPALRSLDLTKVGLGREGADLDKFEALIRSDFVRGLTTLTLSRNLRLTPRVLGALAHSPALASLQTLRLANGSCQDANCWDAFAEYLDLPALAHLDLCSNALGNPGVGAVARCRGLATLRTLDLRGNLIGDKGANGLAVSPHLETIEGLDLRNNPKMRKTARARLVGRFGERVVL